MSYSPHAIRNICLLGHGGNGKTTLVESFLRTTGVIDRLGKTSDGNTVSDYDPEEIKRQISISASVIPVEYNGCKINVLDTPGNFDFAGEVVECLSVADAGILVCAAKGGLSVGTERAWKLLNERKMPRLIYISKMDEDNVDFNSAFDTLREHFGKNIAPMVVPIWDENKRVTGIADVLHKRAFELHDGKRVEIEVPEDKVPVIEEIYEKLMESVAETSEEFMDKYFSGEPFTYAEVVQGLKAGVKDGSIVPVLCGSAYTGLGTMMLLDLIIDLLPTPLEGIPAMGTDREGEPAEFIVSQGAVPAAYVFKTVADQYGKFSFVKVLSDHLSPDMTLVNTNTGNNEKLGRLYVMTGKKNTEVKELMCGDIGAIGKMDKVKTGDTLCDARKFMKLDPLPFAEPNYSKAIAPKVRGQEDKIAAGLARLNEEDPTFRVVNNAETHQMVVTTAGDIQMDVLVSKLKSRFGVEVELSEPRVAYREKIRKSVSKQGRHKKQTGGSGQFAKVLMNFEPLDTENGEVYEFANEVTGGHITKEFIPSIDAGVQEAMESGILAGFPVVGVKATVVDGQVHDVDSSEMAFKIAGSMCFKEAAPKAKPVILEPIMAVEVRTPEEYMGDVMGDLNARRGQIQSMNDATGVKVIDAKVPLSEMFGYIGDLRSKTQGRAMFTMQMDSYAEVPKAVADEIIKAQRGE